MNMNIVKFAKAAAVLALVVSGGAHAGISSKGVAKQLTAVSASGKVAQPAAIVLPAKPWTQESLKAAYASLSKEDKAAAKAIYEALPTTKKAYYKKAFLDLPVSPA